MILTLKEFEDFTPNKKTFGLFGYPIKHTLSPALHTLLLENSDYLGDYIAIDVNPNELEKAFNIAKYKLSGINITIPHKTAIIPLLDVIDTDALNIGCVNTVKFDKELYHIKSHGYNTDIYGFSQSLKLDEINVCGKNVTVLGNGGTALMVCYYMITHGAKLTIAVRDTYKGNELSALLKNTISSNVLSEKIKVCTLDGVNKESDANIIINCTSVGMFPNINSSPIKALPLRCEYVYDVVYNPYMTNLLSMANEYGIKNSNGLNMLILQGAKAQNIWQGISFENSQTDKLSIIHKKLKKLY